MPQVKERGQTARGSIPHESGNGNEMKNNITIKVFQEDFIPGFAGFRNYQDQENMAHAHVVLNVGSLLGMVNQGDCEPSELPYVVAECLMHEIVHVLESWAGVEFSEERVEALIEKYRAKYGVNEEEGAEMEEMSETGVTGKESRTVFMIEQHGLDGVGYWVCNMDGHNVMSANPLSGAMFADKDGAIRAMTQHGITGVKVEEHMFI
jgi:hypothetical protein